ncbi:glycine receptor subunit alpha-1-like [Lineus longissimus]|uniref:glycine receptor subunit alpha-1-like n=1 Tax=Lineus longissimus TaxID=88925 RepID=UPI00315D9F4C
MYLIQRWRDRRLIFTKDQFPEDEITLGYAQLDRIWLPDTYFPGEKEATDHVITTPNVLLRVNRTGHIVYSTRLTLSFSCHMDLVKFPMDNQTCKIKVESYGHTTDEILLQWHTVGPAIKISDDVVVEEFNQGEPFWSEKMESYQTGTFMLLTAGIPMTRQIGYYIVGLYIPSVLTVILSWVSFWLDVNSVPARISLGILTILTTTTQSSGLRSTLPRVSYVKAIDVWLLTNLVFVFIAFLEFAVVNVLARQEAKRRLKRGGPKYKVSDTESDEGDDVGPLPPRTITVRGLRMNTKAVLSMSANTMSNGHMMTSLSNNSGSTDSGIADADVRHDVRIRQKPTKRPKPITFGRTKKSVCTYWKKTEWSERVEVLSRILFPLAYFFFNIAYWTHYLQGVSHRF